MASKKGNGPDAANDQPAKTFTKYTGDFIARAASFATADKGYMLLIIVVLTQAVLMTLPLDLLSGLDWAGLVALGGGVTTATAMFKGTDNPRHLRVIQALMTRPLTREQLDDVAGSNNGPELVAELRRRVIQWITKRNAGVAKNA